MTLQPNIEIESLLSDSLPPEFTTVEAESLLSGRYKAPKKLLESLVQKRKLLRLKKGLYVLPTRYEPLAAAAAIGPVSYVSFESALSFYGLIPERVHSVLSVIDGRSFQHTTQKTRYIFRSQHRKLYAKGMTSVLIAERSVLFATPEKALLDALSNQRLNTKNLSPAQVYSYVLSSFRIEEQSLLEMSLSSLQELSTLYRNQGPSLLVRAISEKG
jgi:hypothetical protein